MSWFSNATGIHLGNVGGIVGGALGSFIPGVGTALGAGLGNFLGGIGSGKNPLASTPATQTTGVDQHTQDQLGAIQGAYGDAGKAGPGPLLNGAAGYFTGAQNAGNLGFGALSGDPAAVGKLMNPYQQNVIDMNNANWQKANLQTSNQVNDAATRTGAFGGSRHGVAEGVALGNNALAQQTQNAQLLQGGYNNAMNQASQLAQFGLQGAGQNANLGFGGVGSPELWRAQMLRQGFIMPTGQQSTQQAGRNPMSGLIGGAITGAQNGGGWKGGLTGGLLGVLGS